VSGAEEFAPLERLIPHSGSMRLLSRVLSHSGGVTVCAIDPADAELFREADGRVPAWVAVEYMAQCVAAHGALLDGHAETGPRPGFLVGAKRISLHRESFAIGESLEVSARVLQRIGRLATLACELRAGGEVAAEGTLSVFVPDSIHMPRVTAS
jgi:predicted hotdog family 3-hydroxylacyl-ACP dehydratase